MLLTSMSRRRTAVDRMAPETPMPAFAGGGEASKGAVPTDDSAADEFVVVVENIPNYVVGLDVDVAAVWEVGSVCNAHPHRGASQSRKPKQ